MITPGEAKESYNWIYNNTVNKEDEKDITDLCVFFSIYRKNYQVNMDKLEFIIGEDKLNIDDKKIKNNELFILDSYKKWISKNSELKYMYLLRLKNILSYVSTDEIGIEETIKLYDNEELFIKCQKEEQDLIIKEKLENLIGLDNVKKEIYNLQNLALVNQKRRSQGLKANTVAMHMVFSGSPGTGKTTVARIIGEIYYSLGIISKKDVREVAREDLLAEYLGQSEIKTKKVLEEAKGGVLFIDEAYSLSEDEDEYGKAVINTLLKFMEDNRDDTLIIVAGYTDEIRKFIKSNPGLESRFNTYLDFPNYSTSELISILQLTITENDYSITCEELNKISIEIDKIDKNDKSFSNARYIRNLFEKAIKVQSSRIIQIENPTKDDLMNLTFDDFFKQ